MSLVMNMIGSIHGIAPKSTRQLLDWRKMPGHLSGWTVHVARPSVHRPATEMLTVGRHDVQLTPDQASSTAAEAREVDGCARRREEKVALSRFWSLPFTYAVDNPTLYQRCISMHQEVLHCYSRLKYVWHALPGGC